MTNLKLLSTGLIAIAVLSTPAIAREHHAAARHFAERANVVTSPAAVNLGGRPCYPAPRVGAYATAPWTGNNVPCEPVPGEY